jgi:hypothetical protein
MRTTLAILLVLASAAWGGAQETTPSAPETPPTAEGATKNAVPEVPPPSAERILVRTAAPVRPVAVAADRAPAAGPWQGAVAVRSELDEAVVRFADGERTLRPGDRLGDAVVREVDEGLVVLHREARDDRPGGAATIVVRFDPSGVPLVRTIHEKDPTRVEPPAVR